PVDDGDQDRLLYDLKRDLENGLNAARPLPRRHFDQLQRHRAQRRIDDQERERQGEPETDQADEEQPLVRAYCPQELGAAHRRQQPVYETDIGLEQVAPHDDRADLGDRVGNQDDRDQQSADRHPSGDQQRDAETEN